MPGEIIVGTRIKGGAVLTPGQLSARGSGVAVPPPPQANPSVFENPIGVGLFGLVAGVDLYTLEQWGGGGNGAQGSLTVGGGGGGGGAYCKYTIGGALLTAGGVLQIYVGSGGTATGGAGSESTVYSPGGVARVSSGPGENGADGGAGGTNTVTAGSGLTVITNTAGSAGSAASGATGGAGGKGGGAGGGAGGAGGASGKAGSVGSPPGGATGGAGALGPMTAGARGKVSISWVPPI